MLKCIILYFKKLIIAKVDFLLTFRRFSDVFPMCLYDNSINFIVFGCFRAIFAIINLSVGKNKSTPPKWQIYGYNSVCIIK